MNDSSLLCVLFLADLIGDAFAAMSDKSDKAIFIMSMSMSIQIQEGQG
jgi:hypothetical protein